MPNKDILEVSIRKTDSGYSVTAKGHGMRETSDFVLPYTQDVLKDMIKKISEFDDAGKLKAPSEEVKEVGLKIYKSLFPTEELRQVLTKCLTLGEGTVNIDLMYDDPEIGKIPWEIIHDGTNTLVASGKMNLVCVIDTNDPFKNIAVKSPLKILVVVSRPLDQPFLEREPPLDRIKNELKAIIAKRKAVFHFLFPPTRDMLVKSLAKGYDIVQFYGHGGFMEGKGCLVFENELGLTELVTADELAVILRGAGVQLVVLCACHSGETAPRSMFTGVAQSLVGACVPAVLGWNFAVPVETALAFMEQFYASLAIRKGASVRKGVAQARRALYGRGTAHFPMLFERTDDDRLVSTGSWSDEELKPPYEEPRNNLAEPLGIHNLLVGRFRDLRELSKALASKENVVALWGFCGVGKTALAVRGVYDRFLWRFQDGVWYVELQGGKTLETLLSELCTHFEFAQELTLTKKEQLVLDRLAHTKSLVILNNFEDVESDKEIISFLNKIRGSSKFLLTTRNEPQQMAWRRYELREMRPEDAFNLFLSMVERANKQIDFSKLNIISEICRRVDYIPIAITYVVGSITGSLEDILNELSENPPDPVKAGFEYAYGNLSANSQKLLSRLSILTSPFRADIIRAMAVPAERNMQLTEWRKCKRELGSKALLFFSGEACHMLTMTSQLSFKHLENPKKWHSISADYYLSLEKYNPFRAFDHLKEAERWREAIDTINSCISAMQYGLAGELSLRLKEAAQIAVEKLQDRLLQCESLCGLGRIFLFQGRFDQSFRSMNKAVAILRDVVKTDPKNTVHQLNLGNCLNDLGQIQAKTGRTDEAEESLEEALEIFRDAVKTDPKNTEYISNLALGLNNLGILQVAIDRTDEAYQSHTEALKICRDLVESDPKNNLYLSDLTTGLNNLGNCQWNLGKTDEAYQSHTEALKIRRDLVESDPKNTEYLSDLAMSFITLGDLQSTMDKTDEAYESLAEAVEILRVLVKSDPNNARYLSDLAMSLCVVGDLQFALDNAEAYQSYTEALKIRRNLVESNPKTAVYLSNLARSLNRMCRIQASMGRYDEAYESLAEAVEILRVLVKSDPNNAHYRNNLEVYLKNVDIIQRMLDGDVKEGKNKL